MVDKQKRIDKKDITEGAQLVLPVGHPDTVFLSPNNYIATKGTVVDYVKYRTPGAYSTAGIGAENGEQTQSDAQFNNDNLYDVPQLTDIESVTFEQYYDPVSKLAKYKAVLKIRNSSKNPNIVAGVDARIYNPNA